MSFGQFTGICNGTSLPLCQVVSPQTNEVLLDLNAGILPKCYARPIELANTMIFQIGNAFVNIGALIILIIILYNIRSKYTAIGRLEMSIYYDIVLGLTISSLIVDCGVSPPGSGSYPYFVAIQLCLTSASCWCLMICGFLGFRFWEDGTRKSLYFIRISSFLIASITFIISILTFKEWIKNGSLDRTNTVGLFITVYILNAIFLFIYIISQIILALFILRNYWVLGVIALAVISFVVGQVIVYALSDPICQALNHYLDGIFFGSLSNLFAYMMLYKFWDMTTDDDLEFSISINKDGEVYYDQ